MVERVTPRTAVLDPGLEFLDLADANAELEHVKSHGDSIRQATPELEQDRSTVENSR